MTIKRRASDLLNKYLNRAGYAVVRLTTGDNGFPHIDTSDDGCFAYENINLMNTLAPWASDLDFLRVRKIVLGNTLVDIYRAYELYQMIREVASLPGDIVEVGVWRGGTGAILAAAAKKWKPAAKVWLCDTFTGVVKAGSQDSAYKGGEHADTSSQIVRDLMTRSGFENVQILEGIFPDGTAGEITAPHIALCHVDVDVYQSALDVVHWVKPRMVAGAIVVFDDYGFSTCQGITRVVDELRNTGDWIYIYNLNKHAILIKR